MDSAEFHDFPVTCVGQIANGTLLSCLPTTTVCEAARLMRQAHCSSIVVLEDDAALGIWTERDALAFDFANPRCFDQPISAVMNASVKVIDRRATIKEAGMRLKEEKIRHLLVVDERGKPCGMLSQTEVVLSHGIEHFLVFRDVRSVMSRQLLSLPADMPVAQAARLLRNSFSEAAVVRSPVWADAEIVTERDILRVIAERHEGSVGEAASRPVVAVHPNESLLTALNLFGKHGFRHLLVREPGGEFATRILLT